MKTKRVIYKLTFPNGKVYIGQTGNFNARMRQHKNGSDNKKRRDYKLPICGAIRKYGWDNIQKEIIKFCSELEIDQKERYYIRKFKSTKNKFGYNLESGGTKLKHHSRQTRKKQSEVALKRFKNGYKSPLKGRKWSLKRKLEFSKVRIGKPSGQKGIKHSIKRREKNRNAQLAVDRKDSKVVLQYDLKGNYLAYYKSIGEAERQTGIDESTIGAICNKSKKKDTKGYYYIKRSAKGFIFIFKKDFSKIEIHSRVKKLEKIHNSIRPKVIQQLEKITGKVIREWKSANKIEQELGLSSSYISKICRGKSITDSEGYIYIPKSAGGFRWKYKK